MASFLLLRLCLLSLTHTAAAALQSSDHMMMFALLGDDVTLPCGIPSIESCYSINWSMAGMFGSFTEVAKAGVVTPSNNVRLRLLNDCSLEINHLVLDDARLYSCDNGALNSSVSLQILQIVENSSPADAIIELQCFLNTYKGHGPCNKRGIHIKWTIQDNTPSNRKRFSIENPSECLSKLKITKKLTDHHRKWKCQLFQNDTVKATNTYTSTIQDGVEEVFTTVGESVSLSCGDTSSLGGGGSVVWSIGGRTLTDDISTQNGQTEAFHVDRESSLVISKVSALHAGNYQCSESTVQQYVFNKVRLHTLDVTSESGPGEENVTLTCVLTCAKECEKDFKLTWSGNSQNSRQSSLMRANNTLIKRLFFTVLSERSDELTCLVHREGEVMASKKWHTVNSLQALAWLALPLGLLIAAVGLCIYMKRKHNKDAGNEESGIGMSHVYEVVLDANNEELHQRQSMGEAATTTDSFYDLLQAVN